MVKLSSTKLVIALGGLALSLSAGAGLASQSRHGSDPLYDRQLLAGCGGTDAESTDMAVRLSQGPAARQMLSSFLERAADRPLKEIINDVQGAIGPEYVDPIVQTAYTCNNY